jgi:hypothetical protein
MRAEDERGPYSALAAQDIGDLSADAHRLREDVAHHAVERVRRVGRPETKVANAPAAYVTLFLETLEGEVYGSLGTVDATDQVAGVKLLAGCAGQICEKPNLGRASAEASSRAQSLHVLDVNTIVL